MLTRGSSIYAMKWQRPHVVHVFILASASTLSISSDKAKNAFLCSGTMILMESSRLLRQLTRIKVWSREAVMQPARCVLKCKAVLILQEFAHQERRKSALTNAAPEFSLGWQPRSVQISLPMGT